MSRHCVSTPPLPDKKYSIIYADPPWSHTVVIRRNDPKRASAASFFYQTLSKTDLCKIPIQRIAEADSLLFMWVSSPLLDEAIEVGTAWGFRYITVGFVWDKRLPVVGYYTMSQCELCLVFKKGKIPQPRGKRNIRQFLSMKRGRHSEKPVKVRQRITEMFPTQSKIEIFARQRFEGWDAWGNEIDDAPPQAIEIQDEPRQQEFVF